VSVTRGYVVVLFGGKADSWCTLDHCPLGTAEWFSTSAEAKAYAETVPEGFQPHVLSVRSSESQEDRSTDGDQGDESSP